MISGQNVTAGRFNIPSQASGLVKTDSVISGNDDSIINGDNDQDLSPEEMEAALEAGAGIPDDLKGGTPDGEEGTQEEEGNDEVNQEEIASLTAKAESDPNSLTEDEVAKLIKANVIEDPNKKTDEVDPKIKAKLDQLAKKDATKLTVEEKKFIQDNTPEPALIDSLKETYSKALGVEIKGDYTNDIAGAQKLADDVSKVRAQSLFEGFIGKDKNLKALYQHFVVEKRGADTFLLKNTEPEFTKIKLDQIKDSNADQVNQAIIGDQKKLLTTYYKSKGNTDDEAKMLIDNFETAGKLYEKAKEAKASLETVFNTAKEAQLKAEEEHRIAEEKSIEDQWNTVRDTLKKNDFSGFSIPATDHGPFMEAILNQNENGISRMDIIRQQRMTLERQLLIDYMLFKDMKIPGLEAKTAKGNRQLVFVKGKEDNKTRKVPTRGADGGLSQADVNSLKGINFKQMYKQ
jgi:ribosomal protein L17